MDYTALIEIILGAVVILQAIIIYQLSKKKNIVVDRMVVQNETVEHETHGQSRADMPKEPAPETKAELKPAAKMEEKKEEKAVEKKHGKGKGFAKCMEIITIPSYVLLVLILIFLVQILLFDYSFMPRFIVGVVILIAIAIIIFRVNKKACKK